MTKKIVEREARVAYAAARRVLESGVDAEEAAIRGIEDVDQEEHPADELPATLRSMAHPTSQPEAVRDEQSEPDLTAGERKAMRQGWDDAVEVARVSALYPKGARVEVFDETGYGVRPSGERVGDGAQWVAGTVEFVTGGPKVGGPVGDVSVYCDDGRGRRVVMPGHVRSLAAPAAVVAERDESAALVNARILAEMTRHLLKALDEGVSPDDMQAAMGDAETACNETERSIAALGPLPQQTWAEAVATSGLTDAQQANLLRLGDMREALAHPAPAEPAASAALDPESPVRTRRVEPARGVEAGERDMALVREAWRCGYTAAAYTDQQAASSAAVEEVLAAIDRTHPRAAPPSSDATKSRVADTERPDIVFRRGYAKGRAETVAGIVAELRERAVSESGLAGPGAPNDFGHRCTAQAFRNAADAIAAKYGAT